MSVVVRRTPEKRWGVLITCLTIRAVHVEIAHSLDTESCILSLRNFMNIRGVPTQIYNDNGNNFKSANNELTKELKNLDMHKFSSRFTSCYTR